jgi:hypothetical protein
MTTPLLAGFIGGYTLTGLAWGASLIVAGTFMLRRLRRRPDSLAFIVLSRSGQIIGLLLFLLVAIPLLRHWLSRS